MATFALDTSCMVAAVCTWHERHAAAAAGIERRLDRGERMAIAAHALVETYAVLTRLPAPHRLAPADAWALVKENFVKRAAVVALTGPAHTSLLEELAAAGIGGGRTYDAVIANSARQAKVATLLTFNSRHFNPPPEGVAVLEPTA
ncbi:MAG: PIN domain-containing protein [Acidobacteria bacterium]|nr:PIN domain-containing protein [Acidobacteriota bacterium]